MIALTFLTCLANMTGSPAVALPFRMPGVDLPFSLQLTGGRARDEALLSVAVQLAPILAGNAK